MIEELAVVVKIDNHQVWVESGQNSACGGCAQKTACTSNVLSSVIKSKAVPVDSVIKLVTGDKVLIAIDESLLLRASLLLYFLPVVALFTGAGIADWLVTENTRYADLWVAGAGLFSFLFILWLINKVQNLLILNYYARPVVVRKI